MRRGPSWPQRAGRHWGGELWQEACPRGGLGDPIKGGCLPACPHLPSCSVSRPGCLPGCWLCLSLQGWPEVTALGAGGWGTPPSPLAPARSWGAASPELSVQPGGLSAAGSVFWVTGLSPGVACLAGLVCVWTRHVCGWVWWGVRPGRGQGWVWGEAAAEWAWLWARRLGCCWQEKAWFFQAGGHQARGYRLVPAASPPPPVLPVSFPDALQKPASALQGSWGLQRPWSDFRECLGWPRSAPRWPCVTPALTAKVQRPATLVGIRSPWKQPAGVLCHAGLQPGSPRLVPCRAARPPPAPPHPPPPAASHLRRNRNTMSISFHSQVTTKMGWWKPRMEPPHGLRNWSLLKAKVLRTGILSWGPAGSPPTCLPAPDAPPQNSTIPSSHRAFSSFSRLGYLLFFLREPFSIKPKISLSPFLRPPPVLPSVLGGFC